MATEKLIAGSGAGLTWASAFGTEVNSVVAGNAILSSIQIDNSSALDLLADFSVSLGSITPTGSPYLGVYLYPLNEDGTTYGDGRFGSSAAGPPPTSYYVGSIACVASAGVQTGTLRGIWLPPGAFKLVVYNNTGVALAGSANVLKYRTYNRQVV